MSLHSAHKKTKGHEIQWEGMVENEEITWEVPSARGTRVLDDLLRPFRHKQYLQERHELH